MKYMLVAASIALTSTAAIAQTATAPANHDAATPAINSSDKMNPGAPVAGANSFTEAQAKDRIEKQGYTQVSSLAKDGDGVWRGTATKDGAQQTVALDFQGNVVTK
jgi:hypothetical protein